MTKKILYFSNALTNALNSTTTQTTHMKKEQYSIVSSSKLPRVAIHEREENEGGGLIWTAEEYRIVRQRHRIVGALLGSLPGYRQQDATRGLPVLLSAEEMHVLETNEWARVIRRRKKKRKEEEEEEEEEETTTTTRKDETMMRQMERDQAKMRALKASKRSRWGGAKKKQKATTTTTKKKKRDEEEGHDDEKSDAIIVDWEQVLGKSSAVVLPLTSETDARLDEDVPEKDDAGERGVLSQMSKIDRYKCAVFKDLHEKGFTMTSAAKFGGDYLAYPGDPMLFHAYFTVRVLERGEKMTPLSCSSVTRMAHAARKNVVFAFCGEEEGEEKNTDGGKKSSANNNHVLRIRYFTCVPDIELSSNRGF